MYILYKYKYSTSTYTYGVEFRMPCLLVLLVDFGKKIDYVHTVCTIHTYRMIGILELTLLGF